VASEVDQITEKKIKSMMKFNINREEPVCVYHLTVQIPSARGRVTATLLSVNFGAQKLLKSRMRVIAWTNNVSETVSRQRVFPFLLFLMLELANGKKRLKHEKQQISLFRSRGNRRHMSEIILACLESDCLVLPSNGYPV
jgi:hypothetical protein